jgi:hypothetical protein
LADARALVNWATQASSDFAWQRWAPDADDEIIVWDKPPLTTSIVYRYASLGAWLEEQALTQDYIDAVTSKLKGVWLNASIKRNYVGVAAVLRDLFLWDALVGMPERDREELRPDLVPGRPDPSRPLTAARREPGLKEEWEGEFGPAGTRRKAGLFQPSPPIKLDP